MFEILLGVAVCVIVAKIASADDQSGILWFGITFALCVGALTIPLPYMRFLIAGIVSVAAMVAFKAITNR